MTDQWSKLEKCKECGRYPIILPIGKNEKSFSCHHGKQLVGTKWYPTAEEWNEAQK